MGKVQELTDKDYYVQARLSPKRDDDTHRACLVKEWKQRGCWVDVVREMIDVYEEHLSQSQRQAENLQLIPKIYEMLCGGTVIAKSADTDIVVGSILSLQDEIKSWGL